MRFVVKQYSVGMCVKEVFRTADEAVGRFVELYPGQARDRVMDELIEEGLFDPEPEGHGTAVAVEDYTSENTQGLDVEQTKELLLRLPEVQALLAGARA